MSALCKAEERVHKEISQKIRDAAYNENLWPGVLTLIGNTFNAPVGTIIAGGLDVSRLTSTNEIKSESRKLLENIWRQGAGLYPENITCFSVDKPSFFSDTEVISAKQVRGEPVFRDLFLPLGFCWGASAGFIPPGGEHRAVQRSLHELQG